MVTAFACRFWSRVSVDFQLAIGQVHDPVILHSGLRVEVSLDAAVESERGIADLDDQEGIPWMIDEVARLTEHNGCIRLGLSASAHVQRLLDAHTMPRPEG